MAKHAIASPSHSSTWLACANSLAAQIGQPEGDKTAADLGSDKHDLLTTCLENATQAAKYIGQVGPFGNSIDEEFAKDVQTVVDNVRARIDNYRNLGCSVIVELEQSLPIEHITGETDATGTGDVVLIVGWPDGHSTADVIDAKFGYSEVLAEMNPQLLMYASGVLEKFGLVEDFSEITLVIEQPLRGDSEWTVTPAVIHEWVETVASPAAVKALAIHNDKLTLLDADYGVTEKGCQWCKASAVCPARRKHVEDAIGASFDQLNNEDATISANIIPVDQLGHFFAQLETIEDWINAVRARVEHELFNGVVIPGLKVVAGKRGNRAWSNDKEAEALLKKFKLPVDQIYKKELLGPKPILELLKRSPRRFKQVEQFVIQAEGKPHVALDSDKRPALEIKPVDDGFELC